MLDAIFGDDPQILPWNNQKPLICSNVNSPKIQKSKYLEKESIVFIF